MSNLYREPSIDASFGSFGHVVSEKFLEIDQPETRIAYDWQPCLLMDRDKISNLYRGPDIDASGKVSLHLAKRFQSKRFKKN